SSEASGCLGEIEVPPDHVVERLKTWNKSLKRGDLRRRAADSCRLAVVAIGSEVPQPIANDRTADGKVGLVRASDRRRASRNVLTVPSSRLQKVRDRSSETIRPRLGHGIDRHTK